MGEAEVKRDPHTDERWPRSPRGRGHTYLREHNQEMRPEREFEIPGVGLLQWWSDAPWQNIHWYVGEDQRPYQVALDAEGLPVYVGDIDGNHIHTIVTPPPLDQEALI